MPIALTPERRKHRGASPEPAGTEPRAEPGRSQGRASRAPRLCQHGVPNMTGLFSPHPAAARAGIAVSGRSAAEPLPPGRAKEHASSYGDPGGHFPGLGRYTRSFPPKAVGSFPCSYACSYVPASFPPYSLMALIFVLPRDQAHAPSPPDTGQSWGMDVLWEL